ncbi:MAG: hypothetical protein WCR56_04525 [Bacilli bacterium]|jgi:hypothetical protein
MTDHDYINGSNGEEYLTNKNLNAANNKYEYSFSYIPTHRYLISLYKENTFYTFNDVVGEGSSATGFNQYNNCYLTFIKDNSSITLTASGKE